MECIRWIVCIKSCCRPRKLRRTYNNSVPWIWIGGHSKYGETIDLTELVSEHTYPNCIIDQTLLRNLDPRCVDWFYVDSETLNEVKIHMNGIQI